MHPPLQNVCAYPRPAHSASGSYRRAHLIFMPTHFGVNNEVQANGVEASRAPYIASCEDIADRYTGQGFGRCNYISAP